MKKSAQDRVPARTPEIPTGEAERERGGWGVRKK